ncbi:tRNA (N6-isopentenyl adenosine(37)-C2)-methylthiotransferase MiaB [Candidatus Peregrinibacteria bacterium RIFOXYB12_FULL_41_12]|nr:MAG: tRNA (N6-isopentenyl adenosine(37)-C2)-methylthiotransferase MiaB [Candidatus Peregrinibacteria bacterium RIFOXYA2_FULL_41_18]OGJ49726.1 MAG: tRNA (N6-isopentenyl adenosine(37)-C2)-methylthiotransferase MiaB [Candidatus Peregrinibacteria bacterium RIFOXYB12_FULL_41_12]OGJ53521.1 MAG: tRNA (N6-isopentenyl adenosine(37)-C2)-methylthiotransferase MiaB [Candidatus Peregrinibacteria bacterium RIFOXYC2_FULL_41_22]
MRKLRYLIQTFGCQMNYSDSERLTTLLDAWGFSPVKTMQSADLIVFNSCSVKQKAEDKVYGQIANTRAIRKKNPKLITVLIGCMVQKGRRFKVDIACKTEEMGGLYDRITELRPEWKLKDFNAKGSLENYFEINPKLTTPSQAFVPIMTGCDKFCTYCIVPYSRGREKSRTFDSVIDECKKLVENGVKEITLIGQTVDSYGLSLSDKKSGKFKKYTDGISTPFSKLLREIDKLHAKGLNRLRFTSPHPKDFSDDLIEAIAELKTTCPYIHLPVQSGSNSCLRRMNRPYTREKYISIINHIRAAIPDCAITTDLIVGFCGETEEEFEDTCKMYKEVGFDMAYLSRYSPRKGTFAAEKMKDNVPAAVKAKRWHKLNLILKKYALKANKRFAGLEVEVLIEKQNEKELIGRSREYKEVHIKKFKKNKNWIGEVLNVKIKKVREWELEGEITK